MAKYKSIAIMIVVAVVSYFIHSYILTYYFTQQSADFSVTTIYAFFICCAAFILFGTHVINAKNHDITGYVFVGLTLVQMGLSYIMLRPILAMGDAGRFERMNFFIIFILFLAIETALTIRLLNNKQ